ncbi:uncharacterized protein [Miscanthus floridulus]|uniref:uncharacterized protein n=1 Tax=Miscanthus floridulus TaxID=154761 RepID=UPI003459617C
MDSSDANVSKENRGPLEDIVQIENSSEPMDDSRWLQESMSTEVTHEALPVDQGFSTAHDEKALSTSGVDPMGEKGLSKIIIVQNKPKKSMSSLVALEDYVCTNTDRAIIESVKKIPSSPGSEELVLIDDVLVSRNHMECLFQPYEYLSDEVIDAYIKLLKA